MTAVSNKKKIKEAQLGGPPGSRFGMDSKGRVYRVLSPGGLQPGCAAVKVKKGLQGSYEGTCIGCMYPTDTGLAIGGDAEVQVGFLMAVGLGRAEALATCQVAWQEQGIWFGDSECVPDGYLTEVYRICQACAPEGFEVAEVHGDLMVHRLRDE